jgi:hypothetical protein
VVWQTGNEALRGCAKKGGSASARYGVLGKLARGVRMPVRGQEPREYKWRALRFLKRFSRTWNAEAAV